MAKDRIPTDIQSVGLELGQAIDRLGECYRARKGRHATARLLCVLRSASSTLDAFLRLWSCRHCKSPLARAHAGPDGAGYCAGCAQDPEVRRLANLRARGEEQDETCLYDRPAWGSRASANAAADWPEPWPPAVDCPSCGGFTSREAAAGEEGAFCPHCCYWKQPFDGATLPHPIPGWLAGFGRFGVTGDPPEVLITPGVNLQFEDLDEEVLERLDPDAVARAVQETMPGIKVLVEHHDPKQRRKKKAGRYRVVDSARGGLDSDHLLGSTDDDIMLLMMLQSVFQLRWHTPIRKLNLGRPLR